MFLEDPRNNFDANFIESAKTSINWLFTPNVFVKDDAFIGMQLPQGFHLPSSVTHIGKRAFSYSILNSDF